MYSKQELEKIDELAIIQQSIDGSLLIFLKGCSL